MIQVGFIDIEPPSSMSINIKKIEDNNSTLRMSDGSHSEDVVAEKRTISLDWEALTWSELSTILKALNVSYPKITYPDPESGIMETREFFVTERGTPVAFMQDNELGENTYYWKDVSVKLEER